MAHAQNNLMFVSAIFTRLAAASHVKVAVDFSQDEHEQRLLDLFAMIEHISKSPRKYHLHRKEGLSLCVCVVAPQMRSRALYCSAMRPRFG